MNPIVQSYSQLAEAYDDERNQSSCWGLSADEALKSIRLADHHRIVADIGCGTGRALLQLASRYPEDRRFIGVEPAEMMRRKAVDLTRHQDHVEILDGPAPV